MRSSKPWSIASIVGLSALLAPALAQAQTGSAAVVVNAGPGDQKDPHVSGDLIAYSSELNGAGEIRYFSLVTREDRAIPNGGAFDYLSDVSGDTVVFTRIAPDRSAILRYDALTGADPVELAPLAGSNRRGASIGHRTVAWEDYGAAQGSAPELVVYDLDTGVAQALSADSLFDTRPAVSPDGQTVVWTKCEGAQGRCDVWQAQAGAGGFVSRALTAGPHSSTHPSTNGALVAYDSVRPNAQGVEDGDIYLQPVGGGTELRLVLPGQDLNPSVSGRYVAFQRRYPDAATPNSDIALYDVEAQLLYRLTDTPGDEQLTDVWISPDAQRVHVVWSVRENGDDNVHALTFRAQDTQCTPTAPATPEQVCASPGTRPLLVSLQLQSVNHGAWDARARYSASGTGVLCVDIGEGRTRALAGLVKVDDRLVVMLESCREDAKLVALEQPLSTEGSVYAAIAGEYGSAFGVRLYGAPPACVPAPAAPLPVQGTRLVPTDAANLGTGGTPGAPDEDGPDRPGRGGCSASGSTAVSAALALLTLALLRPRRVRVPVRRSHR